MKKPLEPPSSRFEDIDEAQQWFLKCVYDPYTFVYNVDMIDAPEERFDEDNGMIYVFTDEGDKKCRDFFDKIFPKGSDFEKDSGLIFW